MNNAGRIGFVLKGDYDNTATYDFLDVVYFGNSSYVAKKLTTGNEPENNSEYWQILATSPDNAVTGIKGATESAFRSGNVILTPENIGALPISGGTVTGNLNVGNNVKINTDQEGGNIRITAPNGQYYEMDAFDSNLRIYSGNSTNGITGQMTLTKTGQLSATGGFRGDADTVDGKHASYLLNYNNLTNKPKYVTDIFFSGNKCTVNYSDGTRKENALDFNIGTSTGLLTQVISNSDIYYYITIGESLVIDKKYQITRAFNPTSGIYIGEKLNYPKFVIKNGSGASATITVEVDNCTAKDMWIPKTFNFTYNGSYVVVTDIAY